MARSLKIKKVSAADLVCSKIKELVTNGTWVADQKIPSESELADTFGVNRLTVRIALQRLNALGILNTRVGDGTYVKTFDFSTHIEEISDFYVNDKVLHDTQEYRWVIESAAIKLAFERPNERLLKKLAQCCKDFEDEVARYYTLTNSEDKKESLGKTVDIGLDFHSVLCELSDNELLRLAFSICKAPIRQHMLVNAMKRIDDPAGNKSIVWVKTYWNVYEAIKSGDIDACFGNLKRLISTPTPKS